MFFLKTCKKLQGEKRSPPLLKTHDVLDHNILLLKLDAYGITGLVNQ